MQTFDTVKKVAGYESNVQNLLNQLDKLHQTNEQLQNKITELELLLELNSYASQRLNRQETLHAIQKLFVSTFKLDEYLLLLKTSSENELEISSHHGIKVNGRVWMDIKSKNNILYDIVKSGQSVYLKELTQKQHFEALGLDGQAGSLLSVPLISEHESILGVINLLRQGENAFQVYEIEFLQLMATHAAGVIDKSILFHTTQELAYNDALTGIFNRRYFDQRFSRELLRAKRYSRDLSILMVDIDHFKTYNDTYGHLMGDKVLQKVASILEDRLRRADILCRYGGEEFVIILPEIDILNAQIVGEKLRTAIMNNSQLDDNIMPGNHVTISVGVASFPQSGENEVNVLGNADKALYKAKDNGRNRVEVSN